jgi:ribosomal protein S30
MSKDAARNLKGTTPPNIQDEEQTPIVQNKNQGTTAPRKKNERVLHKQIEELGKKGKALFKVAALSVRWSRPLDVLFSRGTTVPASRRRCRLLDYFLLLMDFGRARCGRENYWERELLLLFPSAIFEPCLDSCFSLKCYHFFGLPHFSPHSLR